LHGGDGSAGAGAERLVMTEKLADVSPVKLVVALAVTFVVLSAATWFLLIQPKQAKEQSLSSSIKTAQTTLTSLHHRMPAAHRQAVSESLYVGRALPNVVAMPQILLQLNRIATEEHLVLTSVTPGTPIPYVGYQAQPLTVILVGDSLEVTRFLQQLRGQVQVAAGRVTATGRLYDVLGVTIQSTTPAPKVSATLTLQAFSYVPAPVVTDTSATSSTG
jgi:Pilus assembly protein, PilO